MKRSELVAGEDYYFNRGTDWEKGGGWGEQRLTVLSLDKVTEGHSYGFNQHKRPFTIHGGTTVEVDAYPGGSGVIVRDEKGKAFVVPISQLRGPWAETKARVDANAKARLDAANAKREREKAEDARVEAVAERIRQLGINPGDPRRVYAFTERVTGLSLEALEELVELAWYGKDILDERSG